MLVRTFLWRFPGVRLRVGAGLVASRPCGSLRVAWRGVVLGISRLDTPAILLAQLPFRIRHDAE